MSCPISIQRCKDFTRKVHQPSPVASYSSFHVLSTCDMSQTSLPLSAFSKTIWNVRDPFGFANDCLITCPFNHVHGILMGNFNIGKSYGVSEILEKKNEADWSEWSDISTRGKKRTVRDGGGGCKYTNMQKSDFKHRFTLDFIEIPRTSEVTA